jgi:hypothetical protein
VGLRDLEEEEGRVISSESLLDVVQGAGAHTSDIEGHRAFGSGFVRYWMDEWPKPFQGDNRPRGYVDEIVAVVGSAIRGFSVERTAFKASRAREEKLEAARQRLLEPRFLSSPFEGKVASLGYALLAKFIPPIVVVWLTGLTKNPPAWAFLVLLLWVMFGDLLLTGIIIAVQSAVYRASGDVRDQVGNVWVKSFPRYKAMCVDLLISAERIRERYYPGTPGLLPGIAWGAVPAHEVSKFISTPSAALGGMTPAEALSRIVDMHFSLDRSVPSRYVPLKPLPAVPAQK